jgi:hypothetical protein
VCSDKELLFAKDMPYHLFPNRIQWLPEGYIHTFITRHPVAAIKSKFEITRKIQGQFKVIKSAPFSQSSRSPVEFKISSKSSA